MKGLDFLLPPRCTGCSVKVANHGFLCSECWQNLQPLSAPFCTCCALPFEFEADDESLCASCIASPPDFDWARAAVLYENLGRSLVLQLKHSGTSAVVPVMAQMMATALMGSVYDVIVPVPLHKSRFVQRRFNQSILLAKGLAKHTGKPIEAFVLEKKRATESQGGLNRKERFRNVGGVFKISPEKRTTIEGKRALLVDDVLTTGATASSCAKALKKAGALEVGVVAFARVGQPVKG